jgi:hypothetical protein
MIHGYGDHAANERTFLAWVHTGIAVIAFGFVIEKFNLFMLTIASSASGEEARHLRSKGCRDHSGAMRAWRSFSVGSHWSCSQRLASFAPRHYLTPLRSIPPKTCGPS